MEGHGDGRESLSRVVEPNGRRCGDGDGDGDGEIPVAAFLDALELPRAALAHWMDHLDAFFARHGGGRTYADLARLTAETRAALTREGAEESDTPVKDAR
jgi:hypothetical protein